MTIFLWLYFCPARC